MRRWLRRGGYILVLVVWIMIMCFPTLAFVLGTSGEIRIGRQDQQNLRLFMVQEEEANGIGLQWTRRQAGEPKCWLTTVSYLLWQGDFADGNNTRYCQCFDVETGQSLPSGPCP